MQRLGIDIGGSGIKGAPVETVSGKLLARRYRIRTPDPSTPEAVARVVAKICRHFAWQEPIGCGFPAVVQHGYTRTAANVDPSWIGADAQAVIGAATGCETVVLNDADAAGIAEMRFGSGRDQTGVVMIITIGTGLGSALFVDGQLVPNTELGHVELDGRDAETFASDAVRKRKGLSWKAWARRFDRYLNHLEFLFSPDLFILGGGASKKSAKFLHRLTVKARVVPARLQNEAGIIGAALAAERIQNGKDK